MHELQTLQHLVNDILLVYVLKDIGSNNGVKIGIHKIEHKVYVSVILCSDDILKSDNVLMTGQLLQENDFSEGSLSVCCILEGVKVLLESDNVLCLLIDSLPHDAIRTLTYISSCYESLTMHKLPSVACILTQFLEYFVLLQHVSLYLFSHFSNSYKNEL